MSETAWLLIGCAVVAFSAAVVVALALCRAAAWADEQKARKP